MSHFSVAVISQKIVDNFCEIKEMMQKIKKKYHIHLAISQIVTEDKSYESVIECDDYFSNMEFFEDKEKFIEVLKDDCCVAKRKVKLKDGKIENFWIKGEFNPCGCGSNVFHKIYDGKHLYGVCNACKKDIYEFDFEQEYIDNSEWEDI